MSKFICWELSTLSNLSILLYQGIWIIKFIYDHHTNQDELGLSISDVDYSFYYSISVSYFQVETTKVFLRDTSVISPYSLLLFGGSMVIQHQVLWLSSNTRHTGMSSSSFYLYRRHLVLNFLILLERFCPCDFSGGCVLYVGTFRVLSIFYAKIVNGHHIRKRVYFRYFRLTQVYMVMWNCGSDRNFFFSLFGAALESSCVWSYNIWFLISEFSVGKLIVFVSRQELLL